MRATLASTSSRTGARKATTVLLRRPSRSKSMCRMPWAGDVTPLPGPVVRSAGSTRRADPTGVVNDGRPAGASVAARNASRSSYQPSFHART
ncbi:hypothetical protein [Streptomyces litchfieldiae]|uniref:Uncharacterized protein n=1 Tax=Streptomyces litchfieldiae TaxID=3075543 RepID=A0ABU2MS47_9ACTN|nr:hypothetical protein [Streptomyces sp. DSM 44938]MDT0344463.1 hypothetical protein [Streptomyces sp. DSM 44938]